MTPEKENLLERLNKYKHIEDFCWRWLGAVTGRDRPKLTYKEKTVSVARLSLYIYKDFDLDSILHVLHDPVLCKYEDCWNPEHLRLGTNAENMQDKRISITHCPYDHEYTKENTIFDRKGSRLCITCKRRRAREFQRNKRNIVTK